MAGRTETVSSARRHLVRRGGFFTYFLLSTFLPGRNRSARYFVISCFSAYSLFVRPEGLLDAASLSCGLAKPAGSALEASPLLQRGFFDIGFYWPRLRSCYAACGLASSALLLFRHIKAAAILLLRRGNSHAIFHRGGFLSKCRWCH